MVDRAAVAGVDHPLRDTDVKQAPPDNADLPVDRDAVVRYEERNGERAIVYLSTEYHSLYLTRTAGIFFARTVSGVWSPPLYLGLQQHFPYVVTPGSRLPLFDGQRLRIEVQLREIDTAAVGFPLVSLLKRSADGLYLEIIWPPWLPIATATAWPTSPNGASASTSPGPTLMATASSTAATRCRSSPTDPRRPRIRSPAPS